MKFRHARILLLLAALLWLAADWSAQRAQRPAKQPARRPASKPGVDDTAFAKTVLPFVAEHCAGCHSAKAKSGGLDLSGFRTAADVTKHRDQWERVAERIASGEMPPKGMPRPDAAQSEAVTNWIEGLFARVDQEELKRNGLNPGRVTARRLNRAEYNNTVRDLFGVAFQPADDFPADDSGYGFDNIGDVLSLSPLLMEKYLAAADKISQSIIPDFKPMKPMQERFRPDNKAHRFSPVKREKVSETEQTISVELTHDFPVTAEYDLRADLAGPVIPKDQPSVMIRIDLALDGRAINKTQLDRKHEKPWLAGERVLVPAGRHTLRFVIVHDGLRPEDENPRNNKLGFNAIQVQGPFNQQPEPPSAGRKRLFICQEETEGCARRIIADLTHRAYRRPTGAAEIEPLVRLAKMAQSEGDTFAQSIRLALKAVLVSPHFLFRIERDTRPGAHRITDIELASRLSYFLWSSTPDEELLQLAESNRLHEPTVLDAQVQRMMRDARLAGFIENFAGQWLQLRNLDSVKPDPDLFPAFTPELRAAMKTETERFFAAIIGEDRSVLDFIDGRFTFLNETLAKHYGIAGIKGEEFRRVELDGRERSGVLTHGSVLTVSSYPTRTSPVIRGKWILENILNAPPPPPPANVPSLDEKDVGSAASLRERLEQHRADAVCASCHAKMDPLGFGLENYDAIGRWRTRDGKFALDTSGKLPNGKSFATPAELKTILLGDREAFARGLSEKLLTYALGRGLERYDRATVQTISQKLAGDGYKFSRLVKEVVESAPFQMRRGEVSRSAQPAL